MLKSVLIIYEFHLKSVSLRCKNHLKNVVCYALQEDCIVY